MQSLKQEEMIGFDTLLRRHESLYAFVGRVIRLNLLRESELPLVFDRQMLRTAFAPPIAGRSDRAWGKEWGLDDDLLKDKTKAEEWQIFACLEDPEQLFIRACPACLAEGVHVMAFQSELLELCPVHRMPLTRCCPTCGRPMLWKSAASYSRSAFRCVKGCDYLSCPDDGLLGDLAGELEIVTVQLQKYRALVRSQVLMGEGAVIARLPPAGTADNPPRGLIRSLLSGVADFVEDEALKPSIDWSDAELDPWKMSFKDLPVLADNLCPNIDSRLIARCDTDTQFPVANLQDFQRTLDPQIKWSSRRGKVGLGTIQIPSLWLTNEEVRSLVWLLKQPATPMSVRQAAFQMRLSEVVSRGALRRQLLDQSQQVSPTASMGFAYEATGVARVKDQWIAFTARADSNRSQREIMDEWRGHRDLAAPFFLSPIGGDVVLTI